MTSWLIATVAGIGFALLQYGWRSRGWTGRTGPLLLAAAARGIAVTLVVAMLFDAPAGLAKRAASWAALDASESMVRGDSALWRVARDSAQGRGAESTFVFGDSTRRFTADSAPHDHTSALRSVVDRAIAGGHPLIVVTDGELDDPTAVQGLPAGSRVVLVPRRAAPDVAISAIEAPRAVVSGDTIVVRITAVAGAAATTEGQVVLELDGHAIATAPLDALPPNGERQVELTAIITGGPGPAVIRAIAAVPGDAEVRNDTLAVAIERAPAPSAVFVSSSPDFDARYALGVLRGALAISTRAFVRVAPGAWRVDGPLTAVTEQEVRTALREAPVAILHGDTAIFGPPRAATLGPLGLIVPAQQTDVEWYAADAPVSPLAGPLSGILWDSLPPVTLATEQLSGSWTGLEVRRGRTGVRRAIVVGTESPRRTVVVAGSGFWRWQFRGGAASDAYAALWGSIFDWLAAERADQRAALPDAAAFRSGAPIRWRRGSATDTVVAVTLRQSNDGGRVDSMTLHFGSAATVETPPLPVGVYEASVRGGMSLVVVNRSTEWIPRLPTVRAGQVATAAVLGSTPTVRQWGWIYALIVLALCTEWMVRRRMGLR